MARAASWRDRRAILSDLSGFDAVLDAQEAALYAATQLPQRDDNAACTAAANASSSKLSDLHDDGEKLGSCLDISLAILWSRRKGTSDINPRRIRAWSALQDLAANGLTDSSRDFVSLNCLESNREGTVELVRCRFNKQIYVLKSTTKGAAKRGHRSNAPMTERRLLSLAAKNSLKGISTFTPACIAAFQSQASLHVLMEYCPAGDLYHFLDSAGQAPIDNEARNPSGGLLRESYVRSYAVDFVAAISWLHAQDYMHRDIKPGNWLFDKSGHLLLCDLASAAPFATFDEVPASASLPSTAGGSRSASINQRRVLYRHCCLIGTADYIAPEIFWAADLMSRRKERQYESTCADMESALQTADDSDGYGDDEEPPPEGPGLYGPECDWWSVGVMLYEMVYKKLPFFSEKIADTMEMIKTHRQYFEQDPRVQCSEQLRDLLSKLICDSDSRIGSRSSDEVQSHAFFRGIDWSRPWQDPAPFTPQIDALNTSINGSGESSEQPELSVLHSPRVDGSQDVQSFNAGPGNWSKLWAENADQFPAFPNSVAYSRHAEQDQSHESDDTAVEEQSLASQWSDFDPTWIGFTYVPSMDAFDPTSDETRRGRLPSSSPSAALENSSMGSFSTSYPPPMASTPIPNSKVSITSQTAEIVRSVKRAPPASLHRHAVQTATRLRASSNGYNDGRFVTPMRKPSYSTIHFTELDEGGEPISTNAGPPVPPSPYPFPLATVARPRRTPFHPSVGLKRNDLDRARSASAASGEGSDSRCSGGSNAKRDISEREAWYELKVAVLQSARKAQGHNRSDPVSDESSAESDSDEDASEARGTSSAYDNDSHIPRAGALRRAQREPSETSRKKVTFDSQSKSTRNTLQPLARRPELARLLSDEHDRRPLEPVLDLTPPQPSQQSSPSSSPTASLQSISPPVSPGIAALRTYSISDSTPTAASRPSLAKKKSARQLLLKAQHRDTPTRIARTASPLLIEEYPTSTTSATANAVNGIAKGRSHSMRIVERTGVSFERRTASYSDAEAALAMPLPNAVLKLKNAGLGTMRRRDSHEMLSQYRQGINPDDSAAAERPLQTASGNFEIASTLPSALRRPSSLSIRVVAPNNARGSDGSLSSPSLPMFPDAFTGEQPERKGSATRVLVKANSHAVLPRHQLSATTHTEITTTRLNKSQEPTVPLDHSVQAQKQQSRVALATKDSNQQVPHKPEHDASQLRPAQQANGKRPSLMKRASSYLASVGAGKENRPLETTGRITQDASKTAGVHAQAHPVQSDKSKQHGLIISQQAKREQGTIRTTPPADRLRQPSVGNLSKRYERLQIHIHQVENHLERLKARLQAEQ